MSYIHIQPKLMDEDKEIIINCLKHDFPFSMMIGTDNSSAQPEITAEKVKEFCEEQGWVVITKDEYQWLKSLKSKAEEFRWNGGGNY